MNNKAKILNYYKEHSRMSNPSSMIHMFDGIEDDPNEIRKIVQNNMLHIHWLWTLDDLKITDQRKTEILLRTMEEKLTKLEKLGNTNLCDFNKPENKLIGNCRDFSLFSCSLLRHMGIPARLRCGFSTYFTQGKNEDHWITEYYDYKEEKWILLDSQIDGIQKLKLNIDFNTEDLPLGLFLYGGNAWLQCRKREKNPQTFGMLEWWGMEYVLSNFLLDIASLIKVPMLPWDMWDGFKSIKYDQLNENQLATLDSLAVLSLDPDNNFDEISEIYNKYIKVPDDFSLIRSCNS